MLVYRTLDDRAPFNREAFENQKRIIKQRIAQMKLRAKLADENGYVSPEKILYYSKTHQGESVEIINTFSNIDETEIENAKLKALIKKNNEEIAKLKENNESKTAAWGYIKCGVIIILIGTFIGLINNPDMFTSISKKFSSTAKYIRNISANNNNISVFARSLRFFYKRISKFVEDNQLFSMCFAAGVFLIGVGIWKRYF